MLALDAEGYVMEGIPFFEDDYYSDAPTPSTPLVQPFLPPLLDFAAVSQCPPPRKQVIGAFALEGGITLLSGGSGVGKSLLCAAAAVACATGRAFLDWKAEKGAVVFVNPELTSDAMTARLWRVCEAMRIDPPCKDIFLLNLHGAQFGSLAQVADHVLDECDRLAIKPVLVVFDSVYTLMSGDENSVRDVTSGLREIGRVAEATGAAVVVTHHHSKGNQSFKAPIDRFSGSGAFARYCDVSCTLGELSTDNIALPAFAGSESDPTAWRLEFSKCRDTARPAPINLWFDFPVHHVDVVGDLDSASYADARRQGGGLVERAAEFDRRCAEVFGDRDIIDLDELVKAVGLSVNPVKDRLKISDLFEYIPGTGGTNKAKARRKQQPVTCQLVGDRLFNE